MTVPKSQAGIGPGDRFAVIDEKRGCVIFGEVTERKFAPGLKEGWWACRSYTASMPDGTSDLRHRTVMRPLTVNQFETARAAGWDMAVLASSDEGRKVLVAVWTNPEWDGDRT